jgi:HK97 family phage prohead protease
MSTIIRSASPTVLRFAGAGIGPRQIATVTSTENMDRHGEIVVQSGIQLAAFRRSPTVLWNHDSDQPIAKALTIGLEGGKLASLVQFPDEGISDKSDEVYGLIKAGIVNSTSIGFMPIESEPLNPRDPYGPQRYKRVELVEFSFVSVASNREALITGRSTSATPNLDAARARLAEMRRTLTGTR